MRRIDTRPISVDKGERRFQKFHDVAERLVRPVVVIPTLLLAACSGKGGPTDAGGDVSDAIVSPDASISFACPFPTTDTDHVRTFSVGQVMWLKSTRTVRYTFQGLNADSEPYANFTASCDGCIGAVFNVPTDHEITAPFADSRMQLCGAGTSVTCMRGPECTAKVSSSQGWENEFGE
jgi:hypothetical protein